MVYVAQTHKFNTYGIYSSDTNLSIMPKLNHTKQQFQLMNSEVLLNISLTTVNAVMTLQQFNLDIYNAKILYDKNNLRIYNIFPI